jgi:hypothetical protein
MYTILPKKQHQRLRSRKRGFEKFSAGVYEMLRVTLCFPGGWFSHCCWFGGDFGNIVRPVYLPPAFLILTLLAVGLNLYLKMAVLLCLDQSQCVAQTFVFDDRSVADSLILAEDAVGKQEAHLPSGSGHYFREKGAKAEKVVHDLSVKSFFTDRCYPNPPRLGAA